MDEMHPVNSQSPYAASKASADQLALSYYRSFDLPVKGISHLMFMDPTIRKGCYTNNNSTSFTKILKNLI